MELLESRAHGADDRAIKKRVTTMAAAMKELRRDFDDHYRELQANFLPRRGRFDMGSPHSSQRGKKINDKLLNSRPRLALRTLQSGMQAGITSPARPWFQLTTLDPALRKRHAVREYLDSTARVLRQLFQSTGTYNALHVGYGDLGLYGTDCAILDQMPRDGFVLHQLPPGQFWLAADATGSPDSVYFEDWLTVEQVVGRFVYRNDPRNEPDWSVVSRTVKNLWDKGQRLEYVHVGRIICPRRNRDPISLAPDNKPIASIWWEIGASSEGALLRNSGYDNSPIIASRWYKEGTDVYGYSPAMDALADAKMLQQQERDKNEAIRRMNRPPMNAPTSMRNTPFSVTPGAVNFTDDPNGLRPAFEVNPPVAAMREDIRETEERLNEAMFANLFQMLALSDRRQITAREIDERHEEKMIGLGPVLELQHREKLRPLIIAAYTAALRQQLLDPTPEDLDGQKLQIDYVSVLAQAQRAVTTGGIERLFGFAGNLSAVMPSVLDRLDGDAAIDEYAENLGVTPRVLRDDATVQQMREAQAQQAQAQQTAELAATAGPGIKAGVEAGQLLAGASDPRTTQPRDVLNRLGIGGAI